MSYGKLILAILLALPIIYVTDGYWSVHGVDLISMASNFKRNLSSGVKSYSQVFVKNQELMRQNDILRSQVVCLQAKINGLESDVHENKVLKELLSSSSKLEGSFVSATIISWLGDQNIALIDKGASDMVFLGQAVLDGHGVYGQVIQVGSKSSKVKLVNNPKVTIAVKNARNLRGFAHGDGHNILLEHIPVSANIKQGDKIYTSGIAGFYPEGYPYATVTRIYQDKSGTNSAELQPIANLTSSDRLLLFWKEQLLKPPYRSF